MRGHGKDLSVWDSHVNGLIICQHVGMYIKGEGPLPVFLAIVGAKRKGTDQINTSFRYEHFYFTYR